MRGGLSRERRQPRCIPQAVPTRVTPRAKAQSGLVICDSFVGLVLERGPDRRGESAAQVKSAAG